MPNVTASPLSAFTPSRIQSEAYQWLSSICAWDVFATLTTQENTTEPLAHRDLKHFWNVLDRKAYGDDYSGAYPATCYVTYGIDRSM
jgi:hypothetical protein